MSVEAMLIDAAVRKATAERDAEIATLRERLERAEREALAQESRAERLNDELRDANDRIFAAEAALEEARGVLGDIATSCEDKELRYYAAKDLAARKRQQIIDYVHEAARRALAAALSPGAAPREGR